jgi:hypothetical protein
VRLTVHSYRFAEEIIQHGRYAHAWAEIQQVLRGAPLFIYPGKSATNPDLDVVQQLLNTYFDRRMAIDLQWEYHPLATQITNSGLRADYRKRFTATGGPSGPRDLIVQAEFQFGNMGRWYSDIFKFQTAYSQKLIHMALSVVPMATLANRIDSNVVNFERALRELPSADLSITLPILLIGLGVDDNTPIVDTRQAQFPNVAAITRRGAASNRFRLINGVIAGTPIANINPDSPTGPTLEDENGGAEPDD